MKRPWRLTRTLEPPGRRQSQQPSTSTQLELRCRGARHTDAKRRLREHFFCCPLLHVQKRLTVQHNVLHGDLRPRSRSVPPNDAVHARSSEHDALLENDHDETVIDDETPQSTNFDDLAVLRLRLAGSANDYDDATALDGSLESVALSVLAPLADLRKLGQSQLGRKGEKSSPFSARCQSGTSVPEPSVGPSSPRHASPSSALLPWRRSAVSSSNRTSPRVAC